MIGKVYAGSGLVGLGKNAFYCYLFLVRPMQCFVIFISSLSIGFYLRYALVPGNVNCN